MAVCLFICLPCPKLLRWFNSLFLRVIDFLANHLLDFNLLIKDARLFCSPNHQRRWRDTFENNYGGCLLECNIYHAQSDGFLKSDESRIKVDRQWHWQRIMPSTWSQFSGYQQLDILFHNMTMAWHGMHAKRDMKDSKMIADPITVAWMKGNMDPLFGYPEVVRFSWSTAAKLLQESAQSMQWYVLSHTQLHEKILRY